MQLRMYLNVYQFRRCFYSLRLFKMFPHTLQGPHVAALSLLCRGSVAALSLLCRSSIAALSHLCHCSVTARTLLCRGSVAALSLHELNTLNHLLRNQLQVILKVKYKVSIQSNHRSSMTKPVVQY